MNIGVNERATAINQMYVGVDGVARLVYSSGGGGGDFQLPTFSGSSSIFGDATEGRIELYESGTLVLFPGNYDVFLVGGGGNGGVEGTYEGGGGGGGYTKTISAVAISARTEVDITVGAATGVSSFVSSGLSLNYTANGGSSGGSNGNGGSGGSGGGPYTNNNNNGYGGLDGSNGGPGVGKGNPGTGQGTTTRMFGAEGGTLYSGGGGGAYGAYSSSISPNAGGQGGGGHGSVGYPGADAVAGTPNTGGGGGGTRTSSPKAGGSGIVIIRWGTAPELLPNFADNSWENIVWACNNHAVPESWAVGNTKNLQIGSTPVSVAIAAKNHDDLPDGGKAALTFTCTGLYGSNQPMNSSNTNVGSFFGSNMDSYLRDMVFPQFPEEVKNNVKSVVKKTSAGNASSSIRSDNMQIWLFSAVEVGLSASYVSTGEGTVYPYYNNGTRAKGGWWWLRSPYLTANDDFTRVGADGGISASIASAPYGVSFGFSV